MGEKTRTREKVVKASHNGADCEGNDYDKKTCSFVEELQEQIKTLSGEKKSLGDDNEKLKVYNNYLEEEVEGLEGKLQHCGDAFQTTVFSQTIYEELKGHSCDHDNFHRESTLKAFED